MFKSLKDKLKNWVTKNSEKEETVEVIEEETKKKKNTSTKKETKEKEPTKEEKKKGKDEAKKKKEEERELKKKEREEAKEKKREEKKANKKEKEKLLETVKETEERIKETTEEPEEEPKTKSSIFKKILTQEKFDEMFEELQMILITNNVAYDAVEKIKETLEQKLIGKDLKETNISQELKNSIEDLLINPPNFIENIKESIKEKSPYVILFSGINGAGKTTTIAKVANLLQKNKLSVCAVAADTFRAAAIQQLEEHCQKLKIPIIKKDYGTDPASVGFEGIAYAKKNKIDVVLIDTAGRLQNRDSLMKEIEKISRVTKPDMKIFLGESITGNDATEQAKVFNETIRVDGIILSKADVDEKGGTAISVSSVTGKPILFLGTGQNYDDLEVFDKAKVIEQLGL